MFAPGMGKDSYGYKWRKVGFPGARELTRDSKFWGKVVRTYPPASSKAMEVLDEEPAMQVTGQADLQISKHSGVMVQDGYQSYNKG